MGETLNALGLLFVIGLTVYLLVKWGSRQTSKSQKLKATYSGLGIITGFMIFFGLILLPVGPLMQIVISGFCITALLLFLPEEAKNLRLSSTVLIVLLTLILGFHFDLIESNLYFHVKMHNYNILKSVRYSLSEANNQNEVIPAGWFNDPAVKEHLPKGLFSDSALTQLIPIGETSAWYTWLTGIHKERTAHELELWYPGGTIPDAMDKIEFRTRD